MNIAPWCRVVWNLAIKISAFIIIGVQPTSIRRMYMIILRVQVERRMIWSVGRCIDIFAIGTRIRFRVMRVHMILKFLGSITMPYRTSGARHVRAVVVASIIVRIMGWSLNEHIVLYREWAILIWMLVELGDSVVVTSAMARRSS